MRAQRLVGLRRLVADRLLEEVERARGHLLAEAGGLGDRQAMVVVDAEHDVVAQRLARLRAPFGGVGDATRAARRRPCCSWPRRGERRMRVPAVRDQLAWPARSSPARGSARVVAKVGMTSRCLPPSSSIDRHAERLALDVVERDVDRRDRRGAARGRPRNTGCGTSPARARRCASGRGRSGIRDSARWRRHRLLAAGQARLSPQPKMPSSVSTLTSSWLRVPTQTGIGLDGGDLHSDDRLNMTWVGMSIAKRIQGFMMPRSSRNSTGA